MLNLSLFSLRDLQKIKLILDLCKSEQINSLNDLYSIIESKLKKNVEGVVITSPTKTGKKRNTHNYHTCPSCNKPSFKLVRNDENLTIRECTACRYSKIIN